MKPFSCIALCVAYIAACEEPFSPKGPYEERLVVYGILTNSTDTQYVRVFKTYNPPGNSPLENVVDQPVRGATVVVTQGAAYERFGETTIPRIDKSRYSDDITAYAAYSFPVQPGKTYELTVLAGELGRIGSTVTVPERGHVYVANPRVLRGEGGEKENLFVVAYVQQGTRAFIIQFYLDYEVLANGVWTRYRIEVPIGVQHVDDTQNVFSYPKLERRVSSPEFAGDDAVESSVFSKAAYEAKRKELNTLYSANHRVVGALFVLTQVEQNLYTYYSRVNGFLDEYSIRGDLPDWSNITGGYGVFGAMVKDSTYVHLW